MTSLTIGPATPAAAATHRPSEGSVHSWDLSTGVDGPGTRFVTFLSGCPLTCLYCHNPDTWRMRNGTRTSADDVIAEAAKYVRFIAASGGGATLSGGEPLLQPVFTGELLHRMKHELGLHTALDTSGFLGVRATDALLRDTDLVLLDIKSWDPDTYKKVTGRPLRPTLDFARRLADLGQEVHVRFVLVPGLTDAPANVEGVAAFAMRPRQRLPRGHPPLPQARRSQVASTRQAVHPPRHPVPDARAGRRGPRGLPLPRPARRLSDALTLPPRKTGRTGTYALTVAA